MASNFQNVIKGHCKILKVLFFGLIVKIIGLAQVIKRYRSPKDRKANSKLSGNTHCKTI